MTRAITLRQLFLMPYYSGEISICNQAGFYLAEVLSTYSFETVPKELRERVNHFRIFCEVSMAMLCKYRWYRFTMSRFHKPDRLRQHEDEFWQAVKSCASESTPILTQK